MNWIRVSEDDFINLDEIFHIWIQKCPNGFFLIGERKLNQEEVVLSQCYVDKLSCFKHMIKVFSELKSLKTEDY